MADEMTMEQMTEVIRKQAKEIEELKIANQLKDLRVREDLRLL